MPTPHDFEVEPTVSDAEQVAAWAAGGAMALTGRPDGPPLGPPGGLVPKLSAIGARLRERTAASGQALDVDPLALLGERAAIAGLERQGTTSCGGATRLLPAQDGWLAVCLARSDDVELVPAWLERPHSAHGVWSVVEEAVRTSSGSALVERGQLLGLPVSLLPAVPPVAAIAAPAPLAALPLRASEVPGPASSLQELASTVVLDLSSLWAGPLCGSLLAAAGADVIKVESTTRPDGARQGPSRFFDLLNAGKRSVALDLRSQHGRHTLAALAARADVVIEASRPRALEQLGIHAEQTMAAGGPCVWASITGHGRTGVGRNRVAFGDDAAVAGGLVSWDAIGPCFCADAIADPTVGLVAATGILEALAVGGRWLLDVSLQAVAAHLAGATLSVDGGPPPAPPSARAQQARGPALGEHTEVVLAELAVC